MTDINDAISSSGGELVELFIFDFSAVPNSGGGVQYFTSSMFNDTESVIYGGQNYFPLPIELTGVKKQGNAAAVRPKLKLSNINKIFSVVLNNYGDLTGTEITRIRTFRQFLDNGATPDLNAKLPDQSFIIIKVDSVNPFEASFTLGSKMDQPNVKLPRRQVLRDQGFPGVSRAGIRQL